MIHKYLTGKWSCAVLALTLFTMLSQKANAQISGTKNIPGDYATLAAAITDLNSSGVGASGITINLISGNPETAPAGGYTITASGTSAGPIIITGNSNTITAAAAPPAGQKYDAIFKIIGGDYITIQGFNMIENPGNTTGGAVAAQQMTEFGVALFAASTTDGAQYNIIQNNVITLSSATVYQNTIGIFSTSASSSTNGTQAASATSGTNSNNKVYGNTISGVAYGVYFLSVPQTASISETGNEIGGTSASTGNTISYGISNTTPDLGFTSFSGAIVSGIYYRNVTGNTARNNSITSNNALTLACGGIITTNGTAPTGLTYTSVFSNNTIAITNVGTTAITGIDFGSGLSTGTIVCSNNTITINQSAAAAVSAAVIGIKANYASATNTVSANAITINQSNSAGSTTSAVTAITCAGVSTTTNVTDNTNITIRQTITGAGTFGSGAITFIDVSSGGAASVMNVTGNNLNSASGSIRSTGTLTGVNNLSTIALFNVKNNTFSVDRIGLSGTSYFTQTSTTPSELFDTISNNSITFTGLAGTSIVYAINSLGGVSATGTTKNINHNIINITGTNTGATKGIVTGYSLGFIKYNTININVAATAITGIDGVGSGVGSYTTSDNTISVATSGVSAIIFGINMGTTGPHQIFNNSFPVISSTAAAASAPTINVIQLGAGSSNGIYNNMAGNVSTGAGTGSAVVTGISILGGTTTSVYKNKIFSISSDCAGTSTLISGIRVTGGTTLNIYNNIIGGLTAPNAASTDAIRGINLNSTSASTTNNVYYNTIYLNATSTGVNFGTTGLYHAASATATTAALTLANNIIINNSVAAGTGYTVAYRRSSTSLNNYASSSNRNAFYAGTPGTYNVIFSDGTNNDQSVSDFKTRVTPAETNSFSENAAFVSTNPSNSGFLQINTSIATQLESGGIPISSPAITDDYAGTSRNTSTPDIGAFEGSYLLLDIAGPSISYTPLLNTIVGNNQTLTATITDPSGVPVTGIALPTLYYKINSGAYTPVAGASIGSNKYTFTFGAATTTPGDVVSYYIAAQDSNLPTPNVGVFPSVGSLGYSANPPAATTPPTSPSSFTAVSGLSGVITVGTTGATYTSLTGTGGAFDAINNQTLVGDVTVNIIDNTTETGAIALNPVSEAGVGNYKITIQPSGGAARAVTGSVAGGLIRLNGADRVTFDGLNTGGNALSISNTSTASGSAAIMLVSLGQNQGAANDTIRNCTISGGAFTNGVFGIVSGGAAMGSNGDDNDNLCIESNIILKAYYGIVISGTSSVSAGGANGLVIKNNTIGPVTTGTDNIGLYAVVVGNAVAPIITGNTVQNLNASAALAGGIIINTGANNGFVSGNIIKNCTQSGNFVIAAIYDVGTGTLISNNNITAIYNTATGGYAAYGIYVSTNIASSNIAIINNTISDLVSYGDPSTSFLYQPTGIYITGTTGGINIYANSIHLYGDHPGLTSATLFTTIFFESGVTGINLKNNALVNTYGNTSSTTEKSFAIYSNAPMSAFTGIDNNSYFAGGSGNPVLGFIGSNRATLDAIQSGFGGNMNSIHANADFTVPTTLIPTSCFIDNKGIPVVGVSTDFANVTRNSTTPDIGAYEFSSPNTLNTPAITTPINYTLGATASALSATGTGTLVWYTSATGGSGSTTAPVPSTTTPGTVSYYVSDSNTTTNCFSSRAKIDVVVTAPDVYLTASAGNTVGGYNTLKEAFDSINQGAHQGNIAISIYNNITETATAALNASGTGAASYSTILIKPAGNASRIISGNIAGPLIDLNGCDSIIIDGLDSGSNALEIVNSNVGGSVVRFINDASGNMLTNLTLKGTSNTTTSGVVVFSTGTITGNDNNVVSLCNITNSTTTPVNTIYSNGTGTSGIENSNNTIAQNNISNYFSATLATNGILLTATGNTEWIISNNRLFQSSTRIYTTANTHRAIQVAGGSGHTISGNIIGYANENGTGTTNMVGNTIALTGTFPSSYTTTGTANATRYVAIDCGFAAGAAVSSIQNNTITGFALYTSSNTATLNGAFCGINITSGYANIGTVTGNTIGSASGNGSIYMACTATGGIVAGINATSVNTVNIHNNVIGGIDAMGTTATTSGGFNGINSNGTAGIYNISNNTIGNITTANIRTGNLTTGSNLSNIGTTHGIPSGLGKVQGIYNTATGNVLISNNIVRNMVQNSTGTATTSSNIGIVSIAASLITITNNNISNLAGANAYVTVGNGEVSVMGIMVRGGALAGSLISQNTISNLSSTNTIATGTNVTGITVAANGEITISKNKIHGLFNTNLSTSLTAPGTASGILIRSGSALGTPVNIINNMISLGNGQANNTSFIGIWCQSGSTPNPLAKVYSNTVNIEGTATSGAQPSFAFARTDFSATARTTEVDVKNNLFNNTRSGGTGKHYAIANNYGATTVSATGWASNASNFNILNANASTVGYWTTDKDLATWQSASGSDAASFTGIPVTFVNSATDLHLNMGTTPTALESNASTIAAVTVDFDGDARPGPAGSLNGGGFGYDFGADEFDGVSKDLSKPVISLADITNTSITANRTISNVVITDQSGVQVGNGMKPRLYFKKSTDANSISDWKYVEASNNASPFSFTIDYSLLNAGSITASDVIQYFVVAQDSASIPNVGISNGTFAAAPASVALTSTAFPIGGTIKSYIISLTYSGTYTVGSGGTYATLKAFFDVLNIGVVTGNIEIDVVGNTTETATALLNQVSEQPASSNFSIRLKPNGGARTISGTLASSAIIKTVGVSNFTIDGLNTGGNSLAVTNLATTAPIGIHIASAGSSVVSNDSIMNITVNTNLNTGTTLSAIGITISDQAAGGLGSGYFNNAFVNNCTFTKSQYGVVAIGGALAGTANAANINVTNCNFAGTGTNAIGYNAVTFQGVNGGLISKNTIANFDGTANVDDRAIWLATGSKNITIERNHISTLKYTGTGGYGTYGVFLSTGEILSNNVIQNNVITDLSGDGWTYLTTIQDNTHGIFCSGTQTGIKIYNNSIYLGGNTLTQANALTTGICLGTGSTAEVKNNNIVNNSGLNASTGYGSTAIFLQSAINQLESADNNNYVDSATGAGVKLIGKVATTDYATLSSWQAAVLLDSNTVSYHPAFVNLSDLSPTSCNLNNKGANIAGITTDYLGNIRNLITPDIGAYEYTPATVTAPAVSSPVRYCHGTSATALTATGTGTLVWFTAASGGAGSTTAIIPNTTGSALQTYYVADSIPVTGCISNRSSINVAIDTLISNNNITSSAQTICSGSTPVAITASTPTGGNRLTYAYSWLSSVTDANTGFSAIGGANSIGYSPVALSANTWFKRVTTSGECGADTTTAVAVTVNAAGTWTGALSNAWGNTANWSCPLVPVSSTNVTIPSGTTNNPVITDAQQANNIIINTGATLTLNNINAQLSVFGSITNNGTFTNTSGKLNMAGTASQTLIGGTYSDLQISNSNGVSLGGNATISDSLVFVNGTLTLNNNSLTLGNNAFAGGGNATSYIKTNGTGNVIVNNVGTGGKTGNVIVPVGNASYNPVTITNTGTADAYTVWVVDSVTNNYSGNTPSGPKLTTNAVNRTWFINEGLAGGSNASVTLQWSSTDELTSFTRSSSYVSRYTGTVWNSTAGTAAIGSNPYSQTRTAITNFSPFGVGSNNVLPVEMLSFAGSKQQNNTLLKWSTASEKNNKGFDIERSTDAGTWTKVDFIKGNGNTNTISNYSFTDLNAFASSTHHLFYRLKQVDDNGESLYTNIIRVENNIDAKVNTSVQPNPFDNKLEVTIICPVAGNAFVLITDMAGRNIIEQSSSCVEGDNSLAINGIENLKAGVYFVTIKIADNSFTHKVIKQ